MFYVDTSALVKLVVAEAETSGLMAWLTDRDPDLIACDLVRTELIRAVRRSAPERAVDARSVLDSVTLMQITTGVCEDAARLDPSILRTLDGLHIAAALQLGDDLEGLVTYDGRMRDAAVAFGVSVLAPGRG